MQESADTRASPALRPATSELELALVIPCYNEAGRIKGEDFVEFVARHPSCCLQFVDDGSTDDTARSLRELEAQYPKCIFMLSLDENVGKAEAVRRGVMMAIERGYPFVGFWDADLATPLDEAPAMLAALVASPLTHAIIASRVKLLGRHIQRRPARHYLGRIFATCAAVAIDLPVYDSQCGAKIFRVTDCVRRAFGEQFLSRWIFDVELLARVMSCTPRQRDERVLNVIEYPVDSWADIAGSKLKIMDFVNSFAQLGQIWWRYRAP